MRMSRGAAAARSATVEALALWTSDDAVPRAWPFALILAVTVHAGAFFASSATPPRKAPVPITMAISLPPPPPPLPEATPELKKPKPKPPVEAAPPPLPAAPTPAEPPPVDTPPPLATTTQPINLGPATGQGVAVPIGSPDGVQGAQPMAGSAAVATSTVVQTGPAFDPNGYRSGAMGLVNKQKRYPRKARVLGLQGKVLVKALIARDGSLVGPPTIIGKGSGHDVLDEEAIRMVAAAAPFPQIDGDVDLPLVLRFPIEFTLLDP